MCIRDRDGTGLINLYKIDNNGGVSSAGIRLHGDCIYGFSSPAGSDKLGIIFKLQKDGSGFSVIHNFALANGANPKGSPLILDSVLYGVTENGGRANLGVLFEYDLRKDKLLVLHNFLPKTTEHPYRSLLLICLLYTSRCV